MTFEHDYKKALILFQFYDKAKDFDFLCTDVISEVFWQHNLDYQNKELFIDRQLREYYKIIYELSRQFTELQFKKSVLKNMNHRKVIKVDEYTINVNRIENFIEHSDWKQVKDTLTEKYYELISAFEDFKIKVFELKQDYEIKQFV